MPPFSYKTPGIIGRTGPSVTDKISGVLEGGYKTYQAIQGRQAGEAKELRAQEAHGKLMNWRDEQSKLGKIQLERAKSDLERSVSLKDTEKKINDILEQSTLAKQAADLLESREEWGVKEASEIYATVGEEIDNLGPDYDFMGTQYFAQNAQPTDKESYIESLRSYGDNLNKIKEDLIRATNKTVSNVPAKIQQANWLKEQGIDLSPAQHKQLMGVGGIRERYDDMVTLLKEEGDPNPEKTVKAHMFPPKGASTLINKYYTLFNKLLVNAEKVEEQGDKSAEWKEKMENGYFTKNGEWVDGPLKDKPRWFGVDKYESMELYYEKQATILGNKKKVLVTTGDKIRKQMKILSKSPAFTQQMKDVGLYESFLKEETSPERTPVRTGTLNGVQVTEYSDGSIVDSEGNIIKAAE